MLQSVLLLIGLALWTAPFGYEHVITVEKDVVRSVYGTVRDPAGEPIPGVLIEVFDNGVAILDKGTLEERRAKQHKIVEVTTAKDGKFTLPALASGKYELQLRKDNFNVLSVIVTVDTQHGKKSKKGLVCVLPVAT